MRQKKYRPSTIVGTILICLVILYAGWQLRHILDGPAITINPVPSPVAGALVAVGGTAQRIDWLFVNNRQIFTDQQGHFTERLALSPGYNLITVNGKDKFGRATSKTIELIYQATNTNHTI